MDDESILLEARRDKKRSLKLWNYILKRRSFFGEPNSEPGLRDTSNIIPFVTDSQDDELSNQVKTHRFPDDYSHGWEKVPIHKIRSSQSEIESNIVRKKIMGRKNLGYEESSSAELEYLPKSDVFHLTDGNHRVVKDMIRGKKFIAAYVSRPKEIK